MGCLFKLIRPNTDDARRILGLVRFPQKGLRSDCRSPFLMQGEDYELEILTDGEQALQFVHEHRTRVREPELCVIQAEVELAFVRPWNDPQE